MLTMGRKSSKVVYSLLFLLLDMPEAFDITDTTDTN